MSDVSRVTVEVRAERDEERRRMEKMTERQEQIKMEAQPTIQEQRPKFTPIEVEDDWYIVLEVPPKETGTHTFIWTHKYTHTHQTCPSCFQR